MILVVVVASALIRSAQFVFFSVVRTEVHFLAGALPADADLVWLAVSFGLLHRLFTTGRQKVVEWDFFCQSAKTTTLFSLYYITNYFRHRKPPLVNVERNYKVLYFIIHEI